MGYVTEMGIEDIVGAYPTCATCGRSNIVRDACIKWSLLTRDWEMGTVFDTFACETCNADTTPVWKIDEAFRLNRIVRLNDAVRRGDTNHASIVVTAGLRHYGEDYLARVSQAIAAFEDFSEDNDPHGEHDFGAVTIDGAKLFWKIDYFDLALSAHSADKANPEVTHRVLTIMLASEY